ncbi:MAG: O-antigen ligase family protein [Rhodomicrobium sp.]|nr:O-antigen ligase family protein [Rhodomicrobium sp.]
MLLTTAVLFGALMLIPAADDVLKLVSRSGDLQEITSMTGRSEIWTAVPKIVERQSWTGFGYASSIVIIPQHEREIGFLTSHAHNLILQLLLTTGWIGVGLFCLSLLTVGGRALYTGDRTVLVLLAYVIFNGITESSAFTTSPISAPWLSP